MTDLMQRLTAARPTDNDLEAAWSASDRDLALAKIRARSKRPGARRRTPWLLAPIGLAAAAVTAVVVVPGLGPEPAYAVTVDGSGEVHVRVERFEDAAGLEQALEAQGIAADVTYLADDMQCAPGRYDDAPTHPGDFSFSIGNGFGYEVDLDPGVLRDGETLVISGSRLTPTGDPDGDGISDEGGSSASVGVASGEVAPCLSVPVPAEDRPE